MNIAYRFFELLHRLFLNDFSFIRNMKTFSKNEEKVIYEFLLKSAIGGFFYYYMKNMEFKHLFSKEFFNKLDKLRLYTYVRNEKYIELLSEITNEIPEITPIKGMAMLNVYPDIGMRSMGDMDIQGSYKDIKKLREFLEKKGFKCLGKALSKNETFICNNPLLIVDIHYLNELSHYLPEWYGRKVNENKIENKYGLSLSNEDNFIIILEHISKHYISPRCWMSPINAMIDLIFLNKAGLDWDYIWEMLKILSFEKQFNAVRNDIKELFGISIGINSKIIEHSILLPYEKDNAGFSVWNKKIRLMLRHNTYNAILKFFLYKWNCYVRNKKA